MTPQKPVSNQPVFVTPGHRDLHRRAHGTSQGDPRFSKAFFWLCFGCFIDKYMDFYFSVITILNKVSPRTQKQHLFLAVGMVEVDRRIRLAAVRHVLERYRCRYENNPFNLTFLNNEACLRLTLMLRTRPLSTHDYPPFPQDHLHLQPLQPQFPEHFSPQRSMFETNPETCFAHDLCPPTTTPLSPRIISICNPFNLNVLNISARNEACLRLTLKHASYTTSVHPQLPPFSPGSSPSATPSTSISWIFQPTTKHVWD